MLSFYFLFLFFFFFNDTATTGIYTLSLHDALPISGLVPLLEEARAYGQLLKQGWKPRRTIVYAAWDGEEPALLGSTEWAEAHADELAAKAVAYLNSDTNNRGYLNVGGSHSLENFINDVARDIEDPETKLTVWKRAQLRAIADATSTDA